MRQRRRTTVALAAAWLLALVIVVAIALATRPDDVGTNDGAGITLAVSRCPPSLSRPGSFVSPSLRSSQLA